MAPTDNDLDRGSFITATSLLASSSEEEEEEEEDEKEEDEEEELSLLLLLSCLLWIALSSLGGLLPLSSCWLVSDRLFLESSTRPHSSLRLSSSSSLLLLLSPSRSPLVRFRWFLSLSPRHPLATGERGEGDEESRG